MSGVKARYQAQLGDINLLPADANTGGSDLGFLAWNGPVKATTVIGTNSSTSKITGTKPAHIRGTNLWIYFWRNSSGHTVAEVAEIDPVTGLFSSFGTQTTVQNQDVAPVQIFRADADNKFVVYMRDASSGRRQMAVVEVNTSTKAITVGTVLTSIGTQSLDIMVQFDGTSYAHLLPEGNTTNLKYYFITLSGTTLTIQTSNATASGITLQHNTTSNISLHAVGGFKSTRAMLFEYGGTTSPQQMKVHKLQRSGNTISGDSAPLTIYDQSSMQTIKPGPTEGQGDPLYHQIASFVPATNTDDPNDFYVACACSIQNSGSFEWFITIPVILYDDSGDSISIISPHSDIVGNTDFNDLGRSMSSVAVRTSDNSTVSVSFDPLHTGGWFAINHYTVDPRYYPQIGRLFGDGTVLTRISNVQLDASSTVNSRQELGFAISDDLKRALFTTKHDSTTSLLQTAVLS